MSTHLIKRVKNFDPNPPYFVSGLCRVIVSGQFLPALPLYWSELDEALITGPKLIKQPLKKCEEFKSTLRPRKVAKRVMSISGEDNWSFKWGIKYF